MTCRIVCFIARKPSRQAVALAMNNVNKYFPVVGYVEEFEDFLRVLEKLLPQYFKGAHRLFTTSKGTVFLHVSKGGQKWFLTVKPTTNNLSLESLSSEYQHDTCTRPSNDCPSVVYDRKIYSYFYFIGPC